MIAALSGGAASLRVLQTIVGLRRLLSGLFGAALSLACVGATPSSHGADHHGWASAEQAAIVQSGRGEAHLAHVTQGRAATGVPAVTPLALVSTAHGLRRPQRWTRASLLHEVAVFPADNRCTHAARGPPA
jgi:hypothetical protein